MKECSFENCGEQRWGGGFCRKHQQHRTDSQYLRSKAKREAKLKGQKIKPREFKKSETGEGAFLQMILATRPHIDFVTGEPIDDMTVYNCHHVLPKSHYGLWRTNDKNIVFLSTDNHNFVHSMAESDLTTPETSENWEGWVRYFELKRELTIEYNGN
jgi:hypothetical protein